MVIGNPAIHSLSPVMQNAAFELIGEGAVYGYRELDIDDLDSFDELDNSLQDFYAYKLRELIVSEKALSIIKEHSISHCDIIEINATSV